MIRILLATGLALSASVTVAAGFTLSSPDLSPNQKIAQKFVFNSFGCTGDNESPALNWKNAPAGTKSYAIMVHDPDAPTGGAGFWEGGKGTRNQVMMSRKDPRKHRGAAKTESKKMERVGKVAKRSVADDK